jgi:hypothetical protein
VNWNRVLSLIVAAAWIGLVVETSGSREAAKVLLFLIFPFALIWRPDLVGSYSVREGWWQGGSETDSAGCVVRLVGWALLCVPALVTLLIVLHG